MHTPTQTVHTTHKKWKKYWFEAASNSPSSHLTLLSAGFIGVCCNAWYLLTFLAPYPHLVFGWSSAFLFGLSSYLLNTWLPKYCPLLSTFSQPEMVSSTLAPWEKASKLIYLYPTLESLMRGLLLDSPTWVVFECSQLNEFKYCLPLYCFISFTMLSVVQHCL